MNEVASLELSRELYEVSGWNNTEFRWVSIDDEPYRVVSRHEHIALNDSVYLVGGIYNSEFAYSLGYLMRKLPASIPSKEYNGEFAKLWTRKDDHPEDDIKSPTTYLAWYFVTGKVNGVSDFGESADTPENATAKLAIELFKNGILTKETN